MASMGRPSVLTALGELQSAGILTSGRRHLIVKDMARLKALAQGEQLPGGTSCTDDASAM
ncbi:hypothetical protein SSPO_077800 [Streptomyces antimycoticus]|uniref:HTH crp-type domain-containing protein n=1 Tax=Streptomyces antimycoticus TaxID=68175 RepID=A0A499UV84_9ACTN|nr:helix-turn-helix domain-containing protein [Streptomyces antimycoticus]BBJ45062.1 hypothetical protein SSPO_077800 [Streptomyces antimycoticus]